MHLKCAILLSTWDTMLPDVLMDLLVSWPCCLILVVLHQKSNHCTNMMWSLASFSCSHFFKRKCNVQAAAEQNKGLEDMLISGLESFPISSCNAWGLPNLSNRLSLGRYLAVLVVIPFCLIVADMAGMTGQACM